MRPLSWWFPGHLGAVLGTAGLAVLVHRLLLPAAGLPSRAHPAFGGLVVLAAVGLLVLLGLGALRVVRERGQLGAEFYDLARGGFFFLSVLCLCIVSLGSLTYFPHTADFLPAVWWLGAAAWCALGLSWILGLCFRPKPPLAWALVTPGWLLPGASLQTLVIFGLVLDPAWGRGLAAPAAFLLACVLVLLPLGALAARWLLAAHDPATLGPGHWINLGAPAVTALAAAQLAASGNVRMGPLLDLGVLFFWTIAFAWLPLLLFAGLWRHWLHQLPFAFLPENWALVFSPAVFGLATLQLPSVGGGAWTRPAASAAFLFAAAAWTVNAVMSYRARRSK